MAKRLLILLALIPLNSQTAQCAPQNRPNILLILSDDQGYGDLSIYGNTDVHTPHLDRLASQSVMFRNFHAQPVCSPTRAELMTGRCFLEVGVWGVHGGRDYLSLSQRTIADELSAAGYDTAMIGKWHLGKTAPYLPYSRGFNESWSITDRLYQHSDPVLDHNGAREQPQGWTPDILTDLAIEFMERKRGQPFFLYLAYPEVHEPWIAPAELVAKYQGKGFSRSLATVYAMNEQLDASIGRLLASLQKRDLEQNTVVIFLGDNGPINTTSNDLANLTDDEMRHRNPERLRGMKGQLYENGVRVPGLVRWTNHFQPREVSIAADVVDVFPTLLEIAGVPSRDSLRLRGESLVAILKQKANASLSRPVFYANHEAIWPERTRLYSFLPNKSHIAPLRTHLAIRDGRYKLIQIDGRRQLFDLESDPRELHDLSKQQPIEFNSLVEQLERWYEGVLSAPESYRMPEFIVGYAGAKRTYIPACAPSAIFGGVRTESHGTRDWRRDGDGQAFDIHVATAGRYQVLLDATIDNANGRIVAEIGSQELSQPLVAGRGLNLGVCELEIGTCRLQLLLTDVEDETQEIVREIRGVILQSE